MSGLGGSGAATGKEYVGTGAAGITGTDGVCTTRDTWVILRMSNSLNAHWKSPHITAPVAKPGMVPDLPRFQVLRMLPAKAPLMLESSTLRERISPHVNRDILAGSTSAASLSLCLRSSYCFPGIDKTSTGPTRYSRMLKKVADAMPLFRAENNNRGPGGCNLTTPYNPAVKPQTVVACYEYAFGYRLWG